MLIEKKFTPSDTIKVEMAQKKYKKYVFYLVMMSVPMGFLIGYFVSLIKHVPFWMAIIIEFTILLLVLYFVFFTRLNSFKKELLEQIKLIGELEAKSKSEVKGQRTISFDSTELGNINVPQNVYNKIEIGDTLVVEITKYSKYILMLSKNGETLMTGG